jgi:hypothetical protein
VRIDLEGIPPTPTFDTVVAVLDSQGTILDSDDDGGEGLNSRLLFAAPSEGTYIIRARGFAGNSGSYRLSVGEAPPLPPPIAISAGSTMGAFGPTSAVGDVAGEIGRFVEYQFTGREGERVAVALTGPVARVGYMEMFLGSSTDAFADLQAEATAVPTLVALLPRDGEYRLRLGVPANAEGAYELVVSRAMPVLIGEAVHPLARGPSLPGALSLELPVLRMGATGPIRSFYRLYSLPVRRGEVLTVAVSSSEFATALDAGTLSPIGFAVAMTSDLGRESARLVLRPERSGIIHLRVRSSAPAIGNYSIRVEPQPAPPSPTPGSQ